MAFTKERNTKFTKDQWAAISREAALSGLPVSEVIRRAVEIAYLVKPKQPEEAS